MAILARQSAEPRQPVPAGNYYGLCMGVYEIGTQPNSQFGPRRQVVLQFELHRRKGVCRTADGQPLSISQFFNLSFSDRSSLRIVAQNILGRTFTDAEARLGFDVSRLLETGCRLTVAHENRSDGSVRDIIATFLRLEPTDPRLSLASEPALYELDPTEPVPDFVPEWIQKKIHTSAEWLAANPASRPFPRTPGPVPARGRAPQPEPEPVPAGAETPF